jgi:tripartite-type tricarboxylate transporter receptor subunit TctC
MTIAAAAEYPTKPIRLIVPTAPGGGLDIVARMVASKFSENFKQSVIVDNRSGGGGAIGTEAAVKANPDGYTLIAVSAGYATNAALTRLPYDPVNDVSPIVLIGETGFVVTLLPSSPVKSIKELIAYDKANPGKLNYGSSGIGSPLHLITELFNQMAGTKLTHVPYKGSSPAMSDLLGGQIQLLVGPMALMTPQVKSNRLRGIAVTSAKRSSALPDIPTVAETVPGFEAGSWWAILGPKALPKDIVARWNKEVNGILQMPDVKERMAADGLEPAGGPPERFGEVLKRDIAKWQKVVKVGNIKAGI